MGAKAGLAPGLALALAPGDWDRVRAYRSDSESNGLAEEAGVCSTAPPPLLES